MFDIDIQSWRSCRYANIIELRVKLHPYNTFPGTLEDQEAYFSECQLNSTLSQLAILDNPDD